MKRRLVQFFKRQILLKKQKEKQLVDKYDSLHVQWQKKCDKFENSVRKKQKDAKYREVFEKVFPELRKQREEKERLLQKQRAVATAAGGSDENTVNSVVDASADLKAAEVRERNLF